MENLRIMVCPVLDLGLEPVPFAGHFVIHGGWLFNKVNIIKKLALIVVTFCEILGRFCHICGSIRAIRGYYGMCIEAR